MPKESSYQEILRAALEKCPLTRKEIAKNAGIHSTYLSRLLNGANPASDEVNETLEKILGLPEMALRVEAWKMAIPAEIMPMILDDYCETNRLRPVPIDKAERSTKDIRGSDRLGLYKRADRKIQRLDKICRNKHGGEIPLSKIGACATCRVEKAKQDANTKSARTAVKRKQAKQ